MLKKISSSQRHFLFWVIYISYSIVYEAIAFPDDVYPREALFLHYASFVLVFYLTYFSANLFFKNNNRFNYLAFIYFVVGLVSVFGLQTIKNYYIFGQKSPYFGNYIILFGEVFLIITFAIFFSLIEFTELLNQTIFSNLRTKNKRDLLFNKAKKDKLELVNFLDEIINENETQSIVADLKEFRDLVNFLINSTHKALIPITLEIENVRRYIHLYHIRSGQTETFKINIMGEISDLQIPHKSILTLIENCIKHGDLDHSVDINIELKSSFTKIEIKNKIRKSLPLFKSSNIGLANLNARFKLHLPDRHFINTTQEDGWYKVVVMVYDEVVDIKKYGKGKKLQSKIPFYR